jgi:hypothetical protein
MPEITWNCYASSEIGGLFAVITPHYHGWIWVIYRDGLPVRDSLSETGDEWETPAEAMAAAETELRRLVRLKGE